jgi:acyl-CoA synthetase (AMP-forming)/AMP-acid ligase II
MRYLIHHLLENSADRFPAQEAFVHAEARLNYKQLESQSNRLANWLIDRNINKGQRVALLLRNSAAYVIAYYASLKIGCIVVPLNYGLDANEIGQMMNDCRPSVLITENNFQKTIICSLQSLTEKPRFLILAGDSFKLAQSTGISAFKLSRIIGSCSLRRPQISITEKDPSSIIYTSGSTGHPKGVVLSHKNIVSNTRSILSYLKLSRHDRCMVILPFYYVYGKSLLNTHIAVGGTVVVDNRFVFPNAVLKTMIKEKVTGFSGVPSTFTILLNRSSLARLSFPDLRYITSAGGHLPSNVKKRLIEMFPDKKIFIMYGATEASARLTYLSPSDLADHIQSIGKPIPGVEMKVVNEVGEESQFGEEGELIARGPNIMLGYWNFPEETRKVLKDGWYYTGDLGKMDADGFIYVTGRKRDMIKVGLYKVSAIEIEEVLYSYPGLIESAVFGVPDESQGEMIVAAVVPADNVTVEVEDIRKYCKQRLPKYKIPHDFILYKDLPKNKAGKVMKQTLIESCKKSSQIMN